MSDPKRHHFVPQFYLRRFSSGKRFIRCLHKASGQIIPRASIKGQCAIDNFYGWHENIEWSLGIVESRMAQLFRRIDEDAMLPDSRSPEWQEILIFVALQSSRTQLSGRESDEMADYYYKLMLTNEAHEAGIDLSKFRIGSKFPAAFPMQIAIQAYPELNKLDSCLLINNSRMPFLTSDNPVIYYNSRFSNIDYQGVIGLSSQGLQIFYPISPTLMIMLFDPDAYRRPSNTGVKFIREFDAIQLNMLHYLWSGEVVFWESAHIDAGVHEIASCGESYLPYERSITKESELIDIGDELKGSLLHSFRAHAPMEANFRFVQIDKAFLPNNNFMRGHVPPANTNSGREYVFKSESQPRRQLRSVALSSAIRSVSKALELR